MTPNIPATPQTLALLKQKVRDENDPQDVLHAINTTQVYQIKLNRTQRHWLSDLCYEIAEKDGNLTVHQQIELEDIGKLLGVRGYVVP